VCFDEENYDLVHLVHELVYLIQSIVEEERYWRMIDDFDNREWNDLKWNKKRKKYKLAFVQQILECIKLFKETIGCFVFRQQKYLFLYI
jgi:hypothetical protein